MEIRYPCVFCAPPSQVELSGVSVSLWECCGSGSSEVAALTLDHVAVYKDGGRDRVDCSIYHIQVHA